MSIELDQRVRLAAFQWLRAQMDVIGEVLPRSLLAEGFVFDGTRVPLLGPQGIFKPGLMTEAPLSISTIPGGPYDDSIGSGGALKYRYRGTDPAHPDNRRLRLAMEQQLPLVWFWRVQPGQYLASFPVYIVGDHPEQLTFDVQVDDPIAIAPPPAESFVSEDRAAIRREYITSLVRRRVHQQAFRARVIEAYRTHCAFCRLRHQELLDAAHITADAELSGEPVVSNGLSLCKLHHAAFDRHFLTVRPDYTIEVRPSILEESDGPMLIHALQGLHGQPIYLPREASLQPDRDRLEERHAAFIQSSG